MRTPPPETGAPNRLTGPLLWLTVASGGFVFIEPSPYEFCFLLLVWAVVVERLRVPPLLSVPIILLVILFNAGGILSVLQAAHDFDAVRYMLISIYLTVTTIVIAMIVAADPVRYLATLRSAYVLAAVVVAALGIVGYFSGSELLTVNERARATFKDPNVYAPFLIFPALLLARDVLACPLRTALRAAIPLTVILIGILLSFSRAAWAHFIVSGAVLVYLMLVTSPSPVLRLRVMIGSIIGALAAAGLVVALLTLPEVGEMFELRAGIQHYDDGTTGRFGTQIRSIPELMDRPLGYGPLQFPEYHGQAPHNVYLNAFSGYGWLGGVSYLTFVALTLWVGLRCAFVPVAWRPYHLAALATFVGVVLEGLVVDTDHWRHFFLLAGLLWGSAAAVAKTAPEPQPLAGHRQIGGMRAPSTDAVQWSRNPSRPWNRPSEPALSTMAGWPGGDHGKGSG